jgi:acylphosphatase
MSNIKTVHVMISGHVQHVWYRGWAIKQARFFGLDGWVRNRLGGKVEAVFHGPNEKIEQMLLACQDGPEAAKVDEVSIARIEAGDPLKLAGQGFQRWATV